MKPVLQHLADNWPLYAAALLFAVVAVAGALAGIATVSREVGEAPRR